MKEEEIYNLLAKHFSGETTPDEEEAIDVWLKQDPLNKEKYEELKNLWEGTTTAKHNWDIDAAWKNLAARTNLEPVKVPSFTKRRLRIKSRYYYSMAALILLFIGGSLLFNQWGVFKSKENINWIEKVTRAGEKAEIILPDNSKVILNGSSRLKYLSRFEGSSRQVELEGEAYFEVAHNPVLPFIVHSGNISTTVLGTKFNVSAYRNEKNISVSLIEGKVKVSKKESNAEQPIIILKPDQQLIYNNDANTSTVEQFDKDETIGWKDNILKFDNEPLEEVLTRLERAYGTRFELRAESFRDFKVTANFKNESCFTVTEVLKNLTGLEVNTTKENNEVKKIVFEEK